MASTAPRSNKFRSLLLCALLPGAAAASDWDFSPGVGLAQHYSDNVNLAPAAQARSEWITEITPRLSVNRAGGRLQVHADYSLQGLLYANDSQPSRLRHALNGNARAELLDDWLFLDASARYAHEQRNLAGGVGVAGPAGLANTTSVGAYSLSPQIRHRLGSFATLEARIAREGVWVGDTGVSDTEITRYSLMLASDADFYPWSWQFAFDRQDSDNATQADTSSERMNLDARYRLSRAWSVRARAGHEKNDHAGAARTVRDFSYAGLGLGYTPSRRLAADLMYNTSDNGDFYSGNVSLSPTLRTRLTANTTQRAFGRSYGLDLSHRARRATVSLRYQDDLTTSQRQFLANFGTLNAYLCTNGVELYPPGAVPPAAAGCATFLGTVNVVGQTQLNQTFRGKSLIGTLGYNLKRHTWTVNLFDTTRELEGAPGGDSTQGMQATWGYRPATRTTYTLAAGASQVESSGVLGGRADDLWNLSLTVARQFQPDVSGSVVVRHQARQSDQANNDYRENSIAARVNLTF